MSGKTIRKSSDVDEELLDTVERIHPAMRKHWELIVQGRVPFGYSVAEEVFETDPKNYVKRDEEEQPIQPGEELPEDVCPNCGCVHCSCE